MTKKLPIGHRIKDLLLMILAILLYSLGVSLFYGPSGLTPGGLSGLAIVLDRLDFLPFGKGLIILIFNLPILLLGVWRFGFKFLSKTIVAVAASSLLMELLDGILGGFSIPYTIGALPAAIGGGVLVGVSIGMIMRAGCTFGGTDIIIKILRQKYKHMQTGTFYLILDGVIVLFGSVCAAFGEKGFSPENFNMELLIYSILAIFIQSYFSNFVLYGSDGARMLYIITEKEEEISRRITLELHSGVTYLKGIGAYTGSDKHIILCAMRKQQVPGAREIVLQEDPEAFMIVTGASQVLGKGYKRLDSEEL
jgi:uncharacterized membrane-anchored protein YitT (DUF2179 family)